MVDYPLSAATAERTPVIENMLARARAFAEPLIADETLDTGENTLAHADAVAAIVAAMGGSEAMQAASYLVYSCQHLNRPQEVIAKVFGDNFAALAVETTKLVHVQKQARSATASAHLADGAGTQTENVRKMLLAFSRDLRVVMLRLASRLQTLRHAAASKQPVPEGVARESLQVFAPLANRLGIWQVKWEIEDLSFRFLEPETYKLIARLLDEKRIEREGYVEQLRARLERELRPRRASRPTVQGRPKNIYSIVKKMRGKSLDFAQVFDIMALRVVVADVKDCYAALAWVHSHFQPIDEEFDDYIARPKPNGYQSLHTVVREVVDGQAGKPIEIQIRTEEMHDHAEHGVAAHWAYKEAGHKGYAGVWASGEYDAKIAVLRQLLAWERDLSGGSQGQGLFDDRIYVLTPDAAIVELPQGATAVDFAYTVHTSLGHRCRGARVDGAMVPLNTPLQNGQTVEIIAAKEGGPSRDWLNAELGYLASHRARAKVRAWFNAQITHETVARGREAVEKVLQREGKTALKLDDLASQLGFKSADNLFEVVGKDEFSLRNIEMLLRPPEPAPGPDDGVVIKKARASEQCGQGRRAGGRRFVADDAARQVLQAGAARCDPRLRDARPRRQHPSRGLQQLPHDGEPRCRARDRCRVGRAEGRCGLGLRGRRGGRGRRSPGLAARHLRRVRAREDERDRRADAVRQGHRVDDLHDRDRRCRAARAGARRGGRGGRCAFCATSLKSGLAACYNLGFSDTSLGA